METGMIMVSNLGETCSWLFNDLAATSASGLEENGPAITWYPCFFPGVRRMNPSVPCCFSFSSIFSALRKLGKAPTARPYLVSSSRGAIGCSFAAGGPMAGWGGVIPEIPAPSPGGAGGGPGGGAMGAAKGGGVPGAAAAPGKVCGFTSNLPVGPGTGPLLKK